MPTGPDQASYIRVISSDYDGGTSTAVEIRYMPSGHFSVQIGAQFAGVGTFAAGVADAFTLRFDLEAQTASLEINGAEAIAADLDVEAGLESLGFWSMVFYGKTGEAPPLAVDDIGIDWFDPAQPTAGHPIDLDVGEDTIGADFGLKGPWLSLQLDDQSIVEQGGSAIATVTRSFVGDGPLPVSLASGDETEATVPDDVVIPDGEVSVEFDVAAVQDFTADNDQTVTITASATGLTDASTTVTVLDSGEPALSVDIAGNSISESGGVASATVTRNIVTLQSLTVALNSDDQTEATVPDSVVIPADQESATFQVTAVSDNVLDGNQTVTITASAPGMADGIDSLIVLNTSRISGSIDTLTDVDVYGVVLEQGDRIRLGTSTYSLSHAPAIEFRDPGGNLLATSRDGRQFSYVAARSGEYEVRLSAHHANRPYLGSYNYTPSITSFYGADESEPNDDPAQATPIASSDYFRGSLSSAVDVDHYSFEALAGQAAIFKLTNRPEFNPALRLLGPDGQQMLLDAGGAGLVAMLSEAEHRMICRSFRPTHCWASACIRSNSGLAPTALRQSEFLSMTRIWFLSPT